MAKSRMMSQIPVKGGVKKSRFGIKSSSVGDTSIIKYNSPSQTFDIRSNGVGVGNGGLPRHFIPGYGTYMASSIGPQIVASYSSAVFKPGTTITWEPAVGFTTGGRMIVGFCDNPEVVAFIQNLLDLAFLTPASQTLWDNYANAVRSLGSSRSFPIWQETQIPFPTRLRRKRFDSNGVAVVTDVNTLDRSNQTSMFAALSGCTATSGQAGVFHYHDVVDVEGLHNITV